MFRKEKIVPVKFSEKKIQELINENYIFASVLYYFGIKFYDYSEKTLEQVCSENRLDVNVVIESLEKVNKKGEEHDLKLMRYPINLIIEYLKHSHYIFIKKKLPYLAKIIESLKVSQPPFKTISEDIKFVFPLFVEDFIHHIYEEEDTLFLHIQKLDEVVNGKLNPFKIYNNLEKYSLKKYAAEHDAHEEEMQGIRGITDNYNTKDCKDIHLKVVYSELQNFEKELTIHAKIENEVLFPKAITLENQVRKKFMDLVKLN